jgi:hypothetical protein
MFVSSSNRCVGEKSRNLALAGGSKIRPGSSLILQSERDQVRWRSSRMFSTIAAPFPAGPHTCPLQFAMFANVAGGGVEPTERMMALDYCNCVTVTL